MHLLVVGIGETKPGAIGLKQKRSSVFKTTYGSFPSISYLTTFAKGSRLTYLENYYGT